MIFLERAEALASHLVTFTGLHYRKGKGSKNDPTDWKEHDIILNDSGSIEKVTLRNKMDYQGEYVGIKVIKLPQVRRLVNPSSISQVEIDFIGSKETSLYLSVEDYKSGHPLKLKTLDDPYQYKWFHIVMNNGKELDIDYEDNFDLIEKLHIKFDETPIPAEDENLEPAA